MVGSGEDKPADGRIYCRLLGASAPQANKKGLDFHLSP